MRRRKTGKERRPRISLYPCYLAQERRMSSHLKWFVLGIVITLVVLAGGAYLFLKAGGISMETTAAPLPLEKTVADIALRASLGNAADQKNPLQFNDDTLLAAAQKYKQNCAVCHGAPGQARTLISKGMF